MHNVNKYCIANWKMYIHSNQVIKFLNDFKNYNFNNSCKIIICPNFTDLKIVDKLISKHDNIALGAQDISIFENGAYTGDVSLEMLCKSNCLYSIIGHSERRLYYDENDNIINKKLNILNDSPINPIICIGETLNEKKTGNTFSVLKKQFTTIFKDININKSKDYIIAYEPRWAIGTGVAADIETLKSVFEYMKNIIKTIDKNYCNLYLLYGGSVNEINAPEILKISNVDGFLIGSSSVESKTFYNIYNKF